ncbi:MAG TPA: hypothetical protein DGH68_02600 [Bacteroidetes bacterium]|jgi:UDP-glucose:(heptosyl)LPS alpha-1,3-glucosyltransferase|nr:hypothetical protein [Bacteroidota bacterium]
MKIGLVCESCDNRTGIGRIVNYLAGEFLELENEVRCAAQSFEGTHAKLIRRSVPRFSSSKGLNKILFGLNGPPFTGSEVDVMHSFGVGRGAQVVSAQSCHRAGMELLDPFRNEFLERRGFGLYDRVSLYDEKALLTSRSTKRIIAVSKLVKTQVENFYGVNPARVAVVPNGVNISLFEQLRNQIDRPRLRSSVGCSPDDFVVLFVGNEFGRKGLRVVLQSLRALNDRHVRLLVVGRGDRERYSRCAVDLGIADNVLFMGSVSAPETLYFAADAFVFPSLYEPFGIVVLEAMAAGVPVITTRSCGAVETMIHGEHGLYLENPCDIDDLSQQILRVVSDEELRARLAANGKQEARKYDWTSIAFWILNIYREIVGDR